MALLNACERYPRLIPPGSPTSCVLAGLAILYRRAESA